MRKLPALARVRELLDYDRTTGALRWREWSFGRRPDCVAGCVTDSGYRVVTIDRCRVQAHRLAWFYVHGVWPNGEMDHVNGERDDNRLSNLREGDKAANQQNQRRAHKNSRSGLIGAALTRRGDYRAEISVAGKLRHLGRFKTAEDAHKAYVAAKRVLHATCTL